MHIRQRRLFQILAVSSLLAITGCGYSPPPAPAGTGEIEKLGDLAFDPESGRDCRVYLRENGEYCPYLVLTKDYNGSCCLLREYVLSTPRRYTEIERHPDKPAYYRDSELDSYLNGEFLESFSGDLIPRILDSDIEITAFGSIGVMGDDTETITRKVFLLSYHEAGGRSSLTNLKEGAPLRYFSDDSARIARDPLGEAVNWWLRTPNTGDRILVNSVAEDGRIGIRGIYNAPENTEYVDHVRPAICMDPFNELSTALIDGKKVYTVE